MGNIIEPGFYPFWFWNDYINKEEIGYQVREMSSQGVKGFYIHPRQGLQQPYLSESFFEMVDEALKIAEEENLSVSLYDEYPYPSGNAGGAVTMGKPHFYATMLIHRSYEVVGGQIRLQLPQGKILSAKGYPICDGKVVFEEKIDLTDNIGIVLTEDSYLETGLTKYNRKRYFASNPTPVLEASLPDNKYKIYLSIQVEVKNYKYWDNYVDILNPDAVKEFIKLTYEKYKKRYINKFGKSIPMIFVDEVAAIWSHSIPEAFIKEYDYDLIDHMTALQDSSHPEHIKVSYDLYRLKYSMFCNSFEKPISQWCKENGIKYCGEKPGMRLAQLKYIDIPGCDPGHTKAGAKLDILQSSLRGNAKATASAAYFYDKEGALCECYHSIGWSGTLQDAKIIAEGLLLFGIKYLVPHGFFYSTHGLKKHDAPPSFFFQMPYWPLFGILSKRIEKIYKQFGNSFIDAELVVVDPHSGLPSEKNLASYEDILTMLVDNHIDFHVVDTDILEKGSIEENGSVSIKDLKSKVVLIPPMRLIEKPLKEWLDRFQKAGGIVISLSEMTNYNLTLSDIKKHIRPSLTIKNNEGQEISGVYSVKRVTADGRTIWFVLNTTGRDYEADLIPGDKVSLKELSLSEDSDLPLERVDKKEYKRRIRPFESFLLAAIEENDHLDKNTNNYPELRVPIKGKAELNLMNKNLLRMNRWQLSLFRENGNIIDKAVVDCMPLSNQLNKGGVLFTPETREFFGSKPQLEYPHLNLVYEYKFYNQYQGPIEVVMEPGSIIGQWELYVNDSSGFDIDYFNETGSHVRGSMGFDISPWIKEGENTLKISVSTNKASGGLCNPLYLAGDFGVLLEPLSLVEQKEEGSFENYEENLLPYYSGVIEYTTNFSLDIVPDQEYVFLEMGYEQEFYEASEVSVNNSKFKPVLWQPRCIKIKTEYLKQGINAIKTRVYTNLIRSFEGKYFDYKSHNYRDIANI